MAKEIVQADLARIRALLDEVLGHSDYSDVQRMGGLTNCPVNICTTRKMP